MHCRKCRGKVLVEPVYSSESFMSLSCLKCGKSWDLELNGGGNGAIVGKWLKRQMTVVSNGTA
jgi:hypothetical protein